MNLNQTIQTKRLMEVIAFKGWLPSIIDLTEEDNEDKNYEMFYDYRIRTSGGFVDAVFLSAVMLTCFMWGMVIILLLK